MDWGLVVSAICAGGLAGPLTSVALDRFAHRRQRAAWYREQRFRVFSELVSVASVQEPIDDLEHWPDKIRVLSQQVHLLCPKGMAPANLSTAMQNVFGLALERKLGRVDDDLRNWRKQIRNKTREMRALLAEQLHSEG